MPHAYVAPFPSPNASTLTHPVVVTEDQIQQALVQACKRIAPTWPLDKSIAVNPLWGFVEQPIEAVSNYVAYLCGSTLTMPRDWYVEQFHRGQITIEALRAVMKRRSVDLSVEGWLALSSSAPSGNAQRFHLFTDALDAKRDLVHQPSCKDVVTHAIGQHCASWFDQGQARWTLTPARSLYAAWREIASCDNGPSLLTGIDGIADRIAALPETHQELIALVCRRLHIGQYECETYFTALLLSVNGWAAWCAYLAWQADLAGTSDDHLAQLLAIRLAWEWVLMDTPTHESVVAEWRAARGAVGSAEVGTMDVSDKIDWIWQDALDMSWQMQVNQDLMQHQRSTQQGGVDRNVSVRRPTMDAVFCIDVRSERMRRALEKSDPAIRTHGFAGFFGLPIEYLPFAGQKARPQLPGLLAPQIRVVSVANNPETTNHLFAQRRFRLSVSQAWERFRTSASSGFAFVETTGLTYGWKLLKSSLRGAKEKNIDMAALSDQEHGQLFPVMQGVSLEASIQLAAGILRAMSMTSNFAPWVLLVGHGSQSANNPHATGLDCGACCGQSGEINARVLAAMLNREEVRKGLMEQGIHIPADTRFIPALHNTTTDDIRLFDVGVDGLNDLALQQVKCWLLEASERIRTERAPSLGLAARDAGALKKEFLQRAGDWSQVRPEWGLSTNAGFIAAPRERTAHINLEGRSFLHDYDCAADKDFAILEQILTAPVVVAHWINMQYFASTVDNLRWGSGNKVLHNVVGGNIGVFEGNGGDLRTGLPLQSLHDGKQWIHAPLRLSVWVEAPHHAILAIVQKHEKLRQLVTGRWLHLFCIEPTTGNILRCVLDEASPHPWREEVSRD